MKWKTQDLEKYVQAKEYIDTIVLPTNPFGIENDKESMKHAYQNEIMNIFASEIERELSGRVMLTPAYNYLNVSDKDNEIERMEAWVENLQTQPFEHIFYLTFDSSWKKHEKKLSGNLLWIPAPKSVDIQSQEMQEFVRNQTEQVCEVIRSFW